MTTSTPPALKLSDLSMRIDIRAFYEAHGAIVSGKPTNSPRDGKEYASSCPRCGGTDRFSFFDSGRFCCIRGNCNNWHGSSPYWLLRDEGYDHFAALEDLGIDPDEIADSYSQNSPPALPLFLISDECPNKKWIDAAMAFCRACEHVLWSSEGQTARDYLRSRGFKDDTIKQARLGLCHKWYEAPLEDWGLTPGQLNKEDDPRILISRSIIIPYYVDGSIQRIQRRAPDGQYFEVLGSSHCLYFLAPIEDRPVLLVESEFDALSAHQEASDLITAVATGGTPKGRNSRNLTALHQASCILQAFDDDEAGHKAALDWQRLIPGTIRHAPWSHDVNDMLKEDLPIRDWVELGLSGQGEEIESEPILPPALFDLAGQIIPADLIATIPNLVERIFAFQQACLTHKKICCDTLDWMIDPQDGYLICPCVEKAREENRLLDLRIAQEQASKRSSLAFSDW